MYPDCPFCLSNGKLKGSPLYENATFFVLGHLVPERQHAVMIIPKRHTETPFDMLADEWADLPDALAFAKDVLSTWKPDGFTVGWNVGAAAGQTVDHVHLHVICRFKTEAANGEGLNGLIKTTNRANETN